MNRYIKINLKWYFLLGLFLILSNIAAILVQFKKGDLLNNALELDFNLLYQTIVLLFIYIITEVVFMQVVFRCENFIINYVERDMKNDLFGSILQLEYSRFQNTSIGDFLSKFTVMLPTLKSKYFSSITLLMSFCVKIVLITIALTMLNWKIMILTLFLLTMPIYLPKILEKQLQRLQSQHIEKAEKLISYITNILQGFEVIKNFSMEKKIISKFTQINNDANKTSIKNDNYNSLMRGLMAFISYFSYFAIIAFSGYLVFTKEFNAGEFFIAVGMIDQLSYPLIAIAGCIQNIIAAKPLKNDFLEFIAPINTVNDKKATQLKHQILIDKISFRYNDNSSWVLREFSLKIEKGEKYLIQGESGCGKTTLINCLLRYYKIDIGAITIDDVPLNNVANIYEIFSIMRQDVFLFSDTLRYNLTLFDQSISDNKIIEVLKKLGMAKYATYEGLNTYVGDGMLQLSGGERRRIGLARVLLSSKDVVILDEPLANLDEDIKNTIKDYIMSINNKTFIIVSHEWNNKGKYENISGFKSIIEMNSK